MNHRPRLVRGFLFAVLVIVIAAAPLRRLVVTPPASTAILPPPPTTILIYALQSERAWVDWTLDSWPPWLLPSHFSGRTPAYLSFTVINPPPPGTYAAAIRINDITTGYSYTSTVTLTVPAPPPPPPPPPPPTGGCPGFLLDNDGGFLLDDSGGRLTC